MSDVGFLSMEGDVIVNILDTNESPSVGSPTITSPKLMLFDMSMNRY